MKQLNFTTPLSPIGLANLVPAGVVLADLNTNQRNLNLAIDLGTFPKPIKLRSQLYWHQADLDAWVESQRGTPKPAANSDAPEATSTASGLEGGAK